MFIIRGMWLRHNHVPTVGRPHVSQQWRQLRRSKIFGMALRLSSLGVVFLVRRWIFEVCYECQLLSISKHITGHLALAFLRANECFAGNPFSHWCLSRDNLFCALKFQDEDSQEGNLCDDTLGKDSRNCTNKCLLIFVYVIQGSIFLVSRHPISAYAACIST